MKLDDPQQVNGLNIVHGGYPIYSRMVTYADLTST